ncbi:hypothetical protein ABIA38_002904 [Embleya sp. AB8]
MATSMLGCSPWGTATAAGFGGLPVGRPDGDLLSCPELFAEYPAGFGAG